MRALHLVMASIMSASLLFCAETCAQAKNAVGVSKLCLFAWDGYPVWSFPAVAWDGSDSSLAPQWSDWQRRFTKRLAQSVSTVKDALDGELRITAWRDGLMTVDYLDNWSGGSGNPNKQLAKSLLRVSSAQLAFPEKSNAQTISFVMLVQPGSNEPIITRVGTPSHPFRVAMARSNNAAPAAPQQPALNASETNGAALNDNGAETLRAEISESALGLAENSKRYGFGGGWAAGLQDLAATAGEPNTRNNLALDTSGTELFERIKPQITVAGVCNLMICLRPDGQMQMVTLDYLGEPQFLEQLRAAVDALSGSQWARKTAERLASESTGKPQSFTFTGSVTAGPKFPYNLDTSFPESAL